MSEAVEPMSQIKSKVAETLANLTQKRALLEKHKAQYEELKFKLFDYAQMKEGAHPELTVQMTSKARVKAHVVDPSKVLVFLGCEYFVERDPESAVKQVETRLEYLTAAIHEFTQKIKDAKQTVDNIDTLVKYQKEEDESEKMDAVEEEAHNEEGLPFMDIREELDEDGNVMSSTINPQNEKRLQDFGREHGIAPQDELDELNELLQDMGIAKKEESKILEPRVPEPKIQEIEHAGDIIDQTIVDSEANDLVAMSDIVVERDITHPEAVTEFIVERDVTDDLQEAINESVIETEIEEVLKEYIHETGETPMDASMTADKDSQVEETPDHEYFSFLKSMGVISKTQCQIQEPPVIEAKEEPESERSESFGDYDPSQPAIDQDDILQLQLIADEFDDEEIDYDELEYGFDADDTDDDDDDRVDWDEQAQIDKTFVPESSSALFMKELQKLREKKQGNDPHQQSAIDSGVVEEIHTDLQMNKKEKKSVKFSDKLEIKEIENISAELKRNEEAQMKLSRFRQLRKTNSDIAVIPMIPGLRNSVLSDAKSAASPVYIPIVSDIVENVSPVSTHVVEEVPVPEPETKSFKEVINGDIIERDVSSDIVERDSTQHFINPNEPKLKLSKFKSQSLSRPRVSKFRNSVASTPIPTPQAPPEREPEPVPFLVADLTPTSTVISKQPEPNEVSSDQEYDNIKAYILNEDDQEDEELLREMAENITVYTPDMDDDEYRGDDDDDEDDEEEQEEGDYGPMILDQIVENEEVEDPNYFVDDNLIAKEYSDLRRRMMEKYAEKSPNSEDGHPRIVLREEEGQELEPIDQHGNPVKVSRFRKSIGKD